MPFILRGSVICFLALTLLSGCGALKSSRLSSFQNEQEHVQSCGPKAIRGAISRYNALNGIANVRAITLEEISRELRKKNKCSTITRDALSLFVYPAKGMTFPCEVYNYFHRRGFEVKILKNLKEIGEKDVAIVLLKEKGTLNYHWLNHRKYTNTSNFFGKDTVIKRIYLLVK